MATREPGPGESPLFAKGLEMGKQVGGAGPEQCCSAKKGSWVGEGGEEDLLLVAR